MNKEDKKMINDMIQKLESLKDKKLRPFDIDQIQALSGELDEIIEMLEE